MTITVQIPTAFRRFTDGAETLECTATALGELLDQLGERFPDLKRHLRDDSGQLRRFLNIYVNEEDIRFLGGDQYRFQDGDVVMLVPSIAGGAPAEASATAPATSANLGCAFDCAALALNRYLKARAELRDEPGLDICYRGLNPDRVPANSSNLVAQGIRRLAAWAGAEVPGCRVEIENDIPVGVGLGSSAAAVITGLLLGARLVGAEPDPATLLSLAAELDGHPDNVAAAYHGGLVFVATIPSANEVLTWKTTLPADLKLVVVVPEIAMPTREARAVLPEHYSRTDVVHNLQRVALLAAACGSGQYTLLPELFRDRLHQPYRTRSVPGLAACLELSHPSLLGVYLSGSGSSVLALAREAEEEIAFLLVQEFRRQGVGAKPFFLQPDNRGAWVSGVEARSPVETCPAGQEG